MQDGGVTRIPAPPIPPPDRLERADGWLARWRAATSGFQRLKQGHPMYDAVIDEVAGRRIRVGDRWLVDFASCNYLGLDLDPEVIDGVEPYLRAWGTHPSWSRMLGSPVLYEQIEHRLAALLGTEDALALPTLTHIHISVLPVLAGEGTVLMDARAHKTIYDGCAIARSHGATLLRFRHNDPDHLEMLLRTTPTRPILICTDGVNSMTGNPPPLREFAGLAREYGALLYVDDAHGFGVIGQRDPAEPSPYGIRGNGIVKHVDESYDSVIFTAGLSKAYSSLMAFVAAPTDVKDALKVLAAPYLWSGPSPVASLATVLLGLRVNDERGEDFRATIHRLTARVLAALRDLDVYTPNVSGFPIVEIPLADPDDIDEVGRYLFDQGIYVTLAPYPGVPKDQVGFRIQVTAANADDEVDELIAAIARVGERFALRSASAVRIDLEQGRIII